MFELFYIGAIAMMTLAPLLLAAWLVMQVRELVVLARRGVRARCSSCRRCC